MASLRCSVLTASRLPGGPHSAQPPHFSQLHFLVQGLPLSAHQDLQTRGSDIVEVVRPLVAVVVTVVGAAAVTEVAVTVVVAVAEVVLLVVVIVATHGEHPVQQSHEHLNDQLSELCAQKDLHSPNRGLVVLVAVAVVVVIAGEGVVVVGPSVGEVPGTH